MARGLRKKTRTGTHLFFDHGFVVSRTHRKRLFWPPGDGRLEHPNRGSAAHSFAVYETCHLHIACLILPRVFLILEGERGSSVKM